MVDALEIEVIAVHGLDLDAEARRRSQCYPGPDCQPALHQLTFYGDDNKAIAAVNISADALPDMIDSILAAGELDTGQSVVRR
jgi:hypothetical protein